MTNLLSVLKTRAPYVFVRTQEPSRLAWEVAEEYKGKGSVYYFDGFRDALTRYVDGEFKTVLVGHDSEDPEEIDIVRWGTELFRFIDNHPGVLVVPFEKAKAFLGQSDEVLKSYYKKTRSAEFGEYISLVIATSEGDEEKIPGLYRREFAFVDHQFASKKKLAEISKNYGLDDSIGEAAAGLTPQEFVQVLAHFDRNITPEDVVSEKRKILGNASVLDISRPQMTLDDLGGLDKAKSLIHRIAKLWKSPELTEEFGVEPMNRILLLGISGGGKSALCEAVANTLNLELAKGGVSQSMSKWIGESESNMRTMFKTLEALAPVVFWIDEFGRDLSEGHVSDGGTSQRTRGEFLTGIQNLPNNVLLLAAANSLASLSPEMTRADRFDAKMFVGFPTQEEREEIFKIHLGEHHERYKLHDLAEATYGFTGAEIKTLVKSTRFIVATDHQRHFTQDEILAEIPNQRGRIWTDHKEETINMYRHAMGDYLWASSLQEKEASGILRDIQTTTATKKADTSRVKYGNL